MTYLFHYLHLSLSISLPAHIVANATLIENTLIFPTFSLQKKNKHYNIFRNTQFSICDLRYIGNWYLYAKKLIIKKKYFSTVTIN